jgi:hypothetical protein
MKFRKKPVVIDAIQFRRETIEAHLFDNASLPEGVLLGSASYHRADRTISRYKFYIDTLEGRMEVLEGDWIIKGVKGEFYPCKPDIFAATYEAMEDAAHTSIANGDSKS